MYGRGDVTEAVDSELLAKPGHVKRIRNVQTNIPENKYSGKYVSWQHYVCDAGLNPLIHLMHFKRTGHRGLERNETALIVPMRRCHRLSDIYVFDDSEQLSGQ